MSFSARNIVLIIAGFAALAFHSCNENSTGTVNEQGIVLFEKSGLVDSAVVNGCYPNTRRFFVDTLYLDDYSKVKVEFNGAANSDGSYIKVFSNTQSSTNIENYSAEDAQNINAHHEFEFSKPANKIWMEVRIYINPPVCGEGEFKFTSARNLRIYGVK